MKQITIQAQDVRVGDRIYWSSLYTRDKWVPVTRVEPAATDNYINIHIGRKEPYVTYTIKHRREGIAVQREEP